MNLSVNDRARLVDFSEWNSWVSDWWFLLLAGTVVLAAVGMILFSVVYEHIDEFLACLVVLVVVGLWFGLLAMSFNATPPSFASVVEQTWGIRPSCANTNTITGLPQNGTTCWWFRGSEYKEARIVIDGDLVGLAVKDGNGTRLLTPEHTTIHVDEPGIYSFLSDGDEHHD